MTLLAGVDLHETLKSALASSGFPAASVRQGGRTWPGRGFADGAAGTFVPDDKALVPRPGDRMEYAGRVWNVSDATGSEDAWELTLEGEVKPLLDDAGFSFDVTPFAGGRFSVRASASGSYHGRWRLDGGGWSSFDFQGSSWSGKAGKAGALDVDLWRQDRNGVASLPKRESEVLP